MTAPEQTGFQVRVNLADTTHIPHTSCAEALEASDAPLHALCDELEQSKNSFGRVYFKIAAERLRALLSPRSVSLERKEA